MSFQPASLIPKKYFELSTTQTNSEYYCAICSDRFDDYPGETSNSALDKHLINVHNHTPTRENGTATLETNGIKPSPYKAQIPFTFRRSP